MLPCIQFQLKNNYLLKRRITIQLFTFKDMLSSACITLEIISDTKLN